MLVVHYLMEQITTTIDVRKEGAVNTIFDAPKPVAVKLEEIYIDELMNFCNYVDHDMIKVERPNTAL